MSCNYTETNGARFDSLNKEKSKKDREHVFSHEEPFLKKTILILDCWMKLMIAINGRDRVFSK